MGLAQTRCPFFIVAVLGLGLYSGQKEAIESDYFKNAFFNGSSGRTATKARQKFIGARITIFADII